MIARYIPNVPFVVGKRSHCWDLLVAPIEDTFLLGFYFLKANDEKKNKDEKYCVQKVVLCRKTVVPPNSIIMAIHNSCS